MKKKIIAIIAPTATGKTELSLKLARKFNGEIISADSRQIFKEMKIGTDKPDGEWVSDNKMTNNYGGYYLVNNTKHYLMDCLDPSDIFSLADFKKRSEEIIKLLSAKDVTPFVVGGTGLYVSALLDNYTLSEIKVDDKLRLRLEKLSLNQLCEQISKVDPMAAAAIDMNNPRRVIRALEVYLSSGVSIVEQSRQCAANFECLRLGLWRDREVLYQRIDSRIDQMVKDGLLEEIESLLAKGYSWKLNSMSGLGYRQFENYFAGKEKLEDAVNVLKIDTRHYAKRQVSWFKRDKKIKWINADNHVKVEEEIRKYL